MSEGEEFVMVSVRPETRETVRETCKNIDADTYDEAISAPVAEFQTQDRT